MSPAMPAASRVTSVQNSVLRLSSVVFTLDVFMLCRSAKRACTSCGMKHDAETFFSKSIFGAW
jgi:hypothetical protein